MATFRRKAERFRQIKNALIKLCIPIQVTRKCVCSYNIAVILGVRGFNVNTHVSAVVYFVLRMATDELPLPVLTTEIMPCSPAAVLPLPPSITQYSRRLLAECDELNWMNFQVPGHWCYRHPLAQLCNSLTHYGHLCLKR